jgi:hypothetical protein
LLQIGPGVYNYDDYDVFNVDEDEEEDEAMESET